MSCIYLEITSGTQHEAWWIHKQQETASLYFQQNYLQLFVCLSTAVFSPLPHRSSRHARQGNGGLESVKAASLLPAVSFADPWLTVGLSQRKAISFTARLLFQGNADPLHAPRLPALPLGYSGNRSWYRAICLPFVHTPGCATPKRKWGKKGEYCFPNPLGKHWKWFLQPSVWKFWWIAQKIK